MVISSMYAWPFLLIRILQAYREGSYQVAFDLYNQLLDTAEPVRWFYAANGMSTDLLQHSEEHADILINLEAAQKHLDFIEGGYLRALDELSPKISSALETAPPPQPTTAVSLATVSAPAEPETEKKEKKVRLKRVPKGVVPGVTPPPDPERWLKRSERTNFNTGGRRKRGAGGGATQGAMEGSPAPSQGGKGGGKSKRKK